MQTIRRTADGYEFEGEIIGGGISEACDFLRWLGAQDDEIVEVRSNGRVLIRGRLADVAALAYLGIGGATLGRVRRAICWNGNNAAVTPAGRRRPTPRP
jgi:hypothetical protein